MTNSSIRFFCWPVKEMAPAQIDEICCKSTNYLPRQMWMMAWGEGSALTQGAVRYRMTRSLRIAISCAERRRAAVSVIDKPLLATYTLVPRCPSLCGSALLAQQVDVSFGATI